MGVLSVWFFSDSDCQPSLSVSPRSSFERRLWESGWGHWTIVNYMDKNFIILVLSTQKE